MMNMLLLLAILAFFVLGFTLFQYKSLLSSFVGKILQALVTYYFSTLLPHCLASPFTDQTISRGILQWSHTTNPID